MTRRGLPALLAWTAYLLFANVAWLREQLPLRPPNWDRALYLYLSVRFLHAFEDGGVSALAGEFAHRSTTVAPLFPLTTLAGYGIAAIAVVAIAAFVIFRLRELRREEHAEPGQEASAHQPKHRSPTS